MKKNYLIVIFLLISMCSFSLTLDEIKVKLIATIAHVLIKQKIVRVELKDKGFLSSKIAVDNIVFVDNCKKADLIVTDSIKHMGKGCINKLIFVTNYLAYKKAPYAIGALFWQKGRPVLIFNEKTIRKRHIHLPKQFRKYID